MELAEVMRGWKGQGVVGLVWDNAAFHRSRAVGEVDLWAPYSSEVKAVERAEREVWRYVEGRVYGSTEAKKRAVED